MDETENPKPNPGSRDWLDEQKRRMFAEYGDYLARSRYSDNGADAALRRAADIATVILAAKVRW